MYAKTVYTPSLHRVNTSRRRPDPRYSSGRAGATYLCRLVPEDHITRYEVVHFSFWSGSFG